LVQFYADGAKLGEDASNPYSVVWSNVPPGSHQLSAVALDGRGLVATSAVVVISINPLPPDLRFTNTLVSAGALWKYLDDGSNQGSNWVTLRFDDSSWPSGPAELGYGDAANGRPEATVVRSNRTDATRIISTYFRRSFNVTNAPAYSSNLTLRVLRDDGVLVYLNGVEVFRNNLPSGAVTFSDFATATVTGAAETTFLFTNLNPALLLEGANIVAAEIHDANDTENDISFDLEVIGSGSLENVPVYLHALPITNGLFTLWFNAVAGQGYIIDASPTLQAWNPVKTNTAVTTRIDYIEAVPFAGSKFYRVRRTP
jgi:hypothetical protein